MVQQVFCRGTTIFSDVLTDLKASFVRDSDLNGVNLHLGFRDHADRYVYRLLRC